MTGGTTQHGGFSGDGSQDSAKERKRNARLLARAARGRWNVPQDTREKTVRRLEKYLDDDIAPKEAAAIANAFVAMDKADQSADEMEDKAERLDEGLPTENVWQIVIQEARPEPPPQSTPEAG